MSVWRNTKYLFSLTPNPSPEGRGEQTLALRERVARSDG
jgi:hypothetical protein